MNKLIEQVIARRTALGRPKLVDDGAHLWGLALSGGGIRSATFCFGLLRAFARQRLLLRFDLLSTVSGGGYIGGMVGRLFSRAESRKDARRIQAALGDARSNWFVWWLRANGRYLIPQGAKDTTFVAALFIRNLVAVHFELGMIAVSLGIILAATNLGAWQILDHEAYKYPSYLFPLVQDLPSWFPLWFSVIWLALPFFVLVGACRAVAYWTVPWVEKRGWLSIPGWLAVLAITGGLVYIYLYTSTSDSPVGEVMRTTVWTVTATLLTLWLLGVPTGAYYLARVPGTHKRRTDPARTHLTRALANSFRWFSVIALAGIVDRCAWFLAFELEPLTETGQGIAGLWLAGAAAVIRAALPMAGRLLPGRTSTNTILLVGRILGYLLTFLLCVWWVSLVHKAVLGAAFTNLGISFESGWRTLALLAVPIVGFLLVTGRDVDFLNVSSLHAFYQARIVRSYLGAANGARFMTGANGLSALDNVPAVFDNNSRISKTVDDIEPNDDIGLESYTPQKSGGPVHIISVCINQTKDPRGGLFNQDRRGLALSVASGGLLKVSQGAWENLKAPGALSLGSWMAISGAAIAPGLGGMTRGGVSALATFAGVRLGYWWDKATRTNARARFRLFAKSFGMLSETFGIFKGTEKDDWFLTDGGHFENTAAYALLAERAEVIVLADCGADPKYAFENLENLVRKARIDLQAEILFQRPRAVGVLQTPEALGRFGSLNDLASPASTACLAFAKVKYAGQNPGCGIMIVIKPNLCAGLPVDLVNFKVQNPAFPQETTADQFFSEAQWESYFHLGTFLGQHLNRKFIDGLLKDSSLWFEDDDCSPFDVIPETEPAAAAPAVPSRIGRLPSRIGGAVTAVGTTLSLGAAATAGVAAWQAIQSTRESYSKETADQREALKELTELWAKATANGSAPVDIPAAGNLAAALLRTADNLCPTNDESWFIHSDLARRIHESASAQCRLIPDSKMPAACAALVSAVERHADDRRSTCLVPGPEILGVKPPPRYWVYDYTGAGSPTNSHPCDPVVAERENLKLVSTGRERATPSAKCNYTGRFAIGVGSAGPDVQAWPAEPAPVPAPASPPTDVPSPGPTAAAPQPAPPPTQPTPALSHECDDITVFPQIYGPQRRDEVRTFRGTWRRMGASVPPIEDVVDTARARGYSSPPPVTHTTVRFHDAESAACARSLGPRLGMSDWKVEPLSARYRPRPRTVEVWVAPKAEKPRQPEAPLAPVPESSQASPPPIRRSQAPN